MALSPGSRVGPYEIVSPLGAGGMGEVFRARDTRLNREIAIKVLPDAFASDPERLGRFEREAQLLATVNHPHIAAIYGIEGHAIVLELVDGPTLSDRIAAGALPIVEAVRVAQQIAEALEAAHEKGVVHRDLKPGNIKLTPDGEVKVLDFGLAKLLEHDRPDAPASHSPTFSVHATFAGVILGTAPYMSPEQARGRGVDKRADIWAFGCVLFEMLSGARAFDGEDITETLGAIIHKEPAWGKLPADIPVTIRTLLHRCLQKDPKQRLRDIGDARIELSAPASTARVAVDAAGPALSQSTPAMLSGWIAAGVASLVAAALAFGHFRDSPAPEPAMVQFEIAPPDAGSLRLSSPVVSPDGRRVAFLSRDAPGKNVLWVRNVDSLEALALRSADNPENPVFWSADSRVIAFASGGRLRRIDSTGGPSSPLGDVPSADGQFRGGTWSPQGVVILASAGAGLLQMPATGGAATALTTLGTSDVSHTAPVFLPDGRHFLFVRRSRQRDEGGIYLGSLDNAPDRQASKRLVAAGGAPQYASSVEPGVGYVLYLRDSTLMAHRFDPARLELQGEATQLTSNVSAAMPRSFSVVSNAIAYRPESGTTTSHLTWFDRQGKALATLGSPGLWATVDLSRNGKIAAVAQSDTAGSAQLLSVDIERGVFTRVNPEAARDGAPAIADDGRIAFTMAPTGGTLGDLYMRAASGAGEWEMLVQSALLKHANDWSPDGRFLLYDEHHPTRQQDLLVLPVTGDRKPIPVQVSDADETLARFSPDGKWIVYRSNESSRSEIYVRDFAPDRTPAIGTGKWTISSAGGDKPRWSVDGREIYYIAPDQKLMAVPVTTGSTFQPGKAVPLFETNTSGYVPYAVAPDGRFLVNTVPTSTTASSLSHIVVLNWQSMLKSK